MGHSCMQPKGSKKQVAGQRRLFEMEEMPPTPAGQRRSKAPRMEEQGMGYEADMDQSSAQPSQRASTIDDLVASLGSMEMRINANTNTAIGQLVGRIDNVEKAQKTAKEEQAQFVVEVRRMLREQPGEHEKRLQEVKAEMRNEVADRCSRQEIAMSQTTATTSSESGSGVAPGSGHYSSNGRWWPPQQCRVVVTIGGFERDTEAEAIKQRIREELRSRNLEQEPPLRVWTMYEKSSMGFVNAGTPTMATRIVEAWRGERGQNKLWASIESSAEERTFARCQKAVRLNIAEQATLKGIEGRAIASTTSGNIKFCGEVLARLILRDGTVEAEWMEEAFEKYGVSPLLAKAKLEECKRA